VTTDEYKKERKKERDGEIGMDRWKREGVKRLLFVKSPT
jgi:hypothetical protein